MSIPLDQPRPSYPDRLSHHLLKRLRRKLEAQVLERATDADILIACERDVDGMPAKTFTMHPDLLERTPREIERMVARLGSRETIAQSSGEFEGITFCDDGDGNIGEDGILRSARPERAKADGSATSRRGHDGRKADAAARRLTRELLRQLREAAPAPQASDVATVLLVARAVAASGLTLPDILRVLRMRRPIITLVGSVPGFEPCFLDLLRDGLILPGRVALPSGSELGHRHGHFHRPSSERFRAMLFAGKDHDPDQPGVADRKVGRAALLHDPILGVAESEDHLAPRLLCAAQLRLSTGPLGMALLRAVFATVLGSEPQDSLPDESCALLGLTDLAIAIRPGVAVTQAMTILASIAEVRRSEAEAQDGQEGSKGKGKSDGLSGSWKAKSWARGNPGSGSEIIQPARLTGAETDQFIPRVETLSGYGEAADWALALKADLELWRSGDLQWAEMSTKLLLSGPPGTGKTTFARALCNSLQVPLVVSSVTSWLEPGYLGDVLKRIKAAFAEAEELKPSILFIDELDGIGTRHNRGDWSEYTNAIINRALELLDGASRSSGAIVVAATNHPNMIDPALLRSGRLEKHIIIPPPGTTALMGILRHHLRGDLGSVLASAPERTRDAAASGNAVAAAAHGRPSAAAQPDAQGELGSLAAGSPRAGGSGFGRTSQGSGHGDTDVRRRTDEPHRLDLNAGRLWSDPTVPAQLRPTPQNHITPASKGGLSSW
jgi:hypothetical protein